MESNRRLLVSLIVYVLWVVVTVYGGSLLLGGELGSLDQIVKAGIGWQFVAAIALLLGAIMIFRWNDLRFTGPHSVARVMWFPALYLVLLGAGLVFLGLPPASIVVLVGLNTFLVGFSEETMFRGILFSALEKKMAIWPAVLLTSALFGAVHLSNVFITGGLAEAAIQSLAAAISGLVFMAILLRTGSIWPAIIYHGLWDALIFMVSIAAQSSTDAPAASPEPVPGAIFIRSHSTFRT